MSDTAHDYQTPKPVSMEGLEDLFDEFANHEVQGANTLELVREQDASVSVEHAAEILGISSRAVQKRLKKGTLKGLKVKQGGIERWSVNLSVMDREQDASCSVEFANHEVQDANTLELVREQGAPSPIEFANIEYQDTSWAEKSIKDKTAIDDYKDSVIQELQAKLEAATFRVGYLQAQMESSQETIKLLTDSQHKPGWWAKFSSWFFKGQ
jgi:hypothetical protein